MPDKLFNRSILTLVFITISEFLIKCVVSAYCACARHTWQSWTRHALFYSALWLKGVKFLLHVTQHILIYL